jgi:16S rRNA processing protein RimM
VALSSDNPERFVPGAELQARPGRRGVAGARLREQVRLTIESVRGDDDFPIVAFEEITDRGKSEAFGGYILEVAGDALPELEEDEFYPFDLIGLEVRDPSGSVLGRVSDVLDSPGHAILAVALPAGGEALVPFVLAAVPVVEVAEGYLVADPHMISDAAGRPMDEAGDEAAAAPDAEAGGGDAPGDDSRSE